MECSICGISGERKTLFDAIVNNEIVKVCDDCAKQERLLLLGRNRGSSNNLEKSPTVYERLSKIADLNPVEHRAKFDNSESSGVNRQNQYLRKIVDKKKELIFPSLKQVQPQNKEDLIRNFHWAIFNARRARRLTQKQFAEDISESESTVSLLERGVLPNDYHPSAEGHKILAEDIVGYLKKIIPCN